MGSTGNRFLTVLAVLWICLSTLSWHAAATTSPSDFAVLQELQASWPAPNNLPEWSGNDPCGTYWAGVTCDDSGRVISLSLASYNLKGGIPTAIGLLSSLQTLDLSFNEFGGSIPKEIGQLTQLTSLSIIQSGITGSIPSELGNCRNLTFLALNLNSLNGTIPGAIGYLNQLYWFDISENQIVGPLPVSSSSGVGLDNLTGAQHFHFSNNSITGSIPAEIFNPPQLLHLLLDGNSLQGQIPTTVANAQKLQILRLDRNNLVGPLPAELNQMSSLQQLYLNNNSLTQIPNLSALTKLQLLDLSHNAFPKQPVPSWVYSLNYAQTIALDSVNLTGQLNPSIFTLPALQTLSLSHNALNGSVTFTGVSPSSLALIDLQNNQFNGFQAPTMANGVNASDIPIQLAGNPLCSSRSYTGIAVCKRSDDSPFSWQASPNPLCGKSCKDGATLNPNLCNCAFPLTCVLQLTAPSFSTVNDSSIASLSNEWADKFQLDDRQVYIGYANFTLDRRLIFNLLFFPLSGNALNNSEVNNITADLRSNNNSLQEGPWLLLENPILPLPGGSSKSSIGVGVIVGIVVAMLVVASLIGLVVLYAIRQKRRADKAEDSRPFASWGGGKGDPGEAPQLKGARWFSLAELSRATNNFDQDNEIGAGGYGKVYRAILPTGDVFAVKRAEEGSMQGATEFKNEIELLSRVHHRNLVGLVGFCYEQGEQLLVYEFMPNGTLRDHLLGHTEVPLTWEMRVAIALGSAKGLAYLHDLANPPIIHRDFKSSNILLDERMIAKVADFGLSKLAPDGADKKHVSTQVKGTLGYLDPEYYMTNQLSAKSDVYSFGVVLLEILSARQPIERGRYIVREVRTALNKGGMRALEPLLDPFLGDYPRKQLDAFLDLALHCVEESAASRPTMNECVKELEVIFGRSQTNAGVHITVEPQKVEDDLYGQVHYKNENDPSFQYSGTAFAPVTVEPK